MTVAFKYVGSYHEEQRIHLVCVTPERRAVADGDVIGRPISALCKEDLSRNQSLPTMVGGPLCLQQSLQMFVRGDSCTGWEIV